MANITLDTRIAHKIDTREKWGASTLVLLKGELALDEFGTYKVGDGTKTWKDLPFSGGSVIHEADTDPTTSDTNFDIGQHWLNTTTKEYFILADKATGLWLHMTHTSENDVTKSYVDEQLALKADKTTMTEELAKKANITDVFTQQQVTEKLAAKADLVEGKVPASQLPSYVDDVLEFENKDAFPAAEQAESGKIYVALDTNITYRWGGSDYVEISASLALGETASTAFPGDRGKTLEEKVTTLEGTAAGLGALATKDTVTAAELSADAVETAKIKDLNVTEAKLADGAVATTKIADEAVVEGKVAAGAISETKLAASAVTEAKLADASVSAGKIAANAVVAEKIADGAVTDAKIVSLALDKLTNATTNTVIFSCGNSEE